MATIRQLPSGHWHVQIRLKGRKATETFLRHDHAREWATQTEAKVDRGHAPSGRRARSAKTFGALIDLHIDDIKEVGKAPGRSKSATLEMLQRRLASNDFRANLPRFTPEAMEANQALVDLLAELGRQKQATPAQIALAWLLARESYVVPIPGTTKLSRLEENIGSATLHLTAQDLQHIETAAAKIHVEGERYPAHLMATVGR